MGFNEKLLEEIIRLGDKAFTGRELEDKLNFRSRTERKILEAAVKDLIHEGSLIETGGGKIAAAVYQKLIKGSLRGNKKGFAFLIREDGGEDMFIPNRSLSGALHGDTVLVRKTGDSEGSVVKVLTRGIDRLVGTYIRSGKFGFVVPDDESYYKDIFVPFDKTMDARPFSKVVVSVKIDPSNGKPVGEVLEVLGLSGERNADVLSILKNYGFNDKFPADVIAASEKVAYKYPAGRLDLRELLTITIDGDDAKDFDDAISIEKKGGIYKLYVHIADVSEYVKLGGLMDQEAFERGTSVYFPGSVYPMLPESISNGVCSLRPNEEKLTVTAIMDVDMNGGVTAMDFKETVIKSNYRMTYTNVTKILAGDPEMNEKYADIVDMLKLSKELAGILEKKRNSRGAINFVTRETKVTLDSKGDVLEIAPYPYEVSNGIIEQFMILANECVAKHLNDRGIPCVYRVHEAPDEMKLQTFRQFIGNFGYELDVEKGVKPRAFSDLLNRIKGNPAEHVISKIMLRTMQKAKYSPANIGHFGLSSDYYCHFTSPIRRYPDLMVHRVLKAAVTGKADERFVLKYRSLCDSASVSSSEREVAAERAERDIDDYYKALYMSKHIGEHYKGIVSGAVSTGIFVELDNTAEGFVSVNDLPEDRYELAEGIYRLQGVRYSFGIGDSVEVIVKSATPETGDVDMTLTGDVKNYIRKTGGKPSSSEIKPGEQKPRRKEARPSSASRASGKPRQGRSNSGKPGQGRRNSGGSGKSGAGKGGRNGRGSKDYSQE